eukprot:253592-Pleurochrysis_carterae.AAC.1
MRIRGHCAWLLPDLRDFLFRSFKRPFIRPCRCVLGLTQLRHAKDRAHQDLSSREVHKAAGFAEHLFTMVLQSREQIVAAVSECAALQRCFDACTRLEPQAAAIASDAADAADAPAAPAAPAAAPAATAPAPAPAPADGRGAHASAAAKGAAQQSSSAPLALHYPLCPQRVLSRRLRRCESLRRETLQLAFDSRVLMQQLSRLPTPPGATAAAAATSHRAHGRGTGSGGGAVGVENDGEDAWALECSVSGPRQLLGAVAALDRLVLQIRQPFTISDEQTMVVFTSDDVRKLQRCGEKVKTAYEDVISAVDELARPEQGMLEPLLLHLRQLIEAATAPFDAQAERHGLGEKSAGKRQDLASVASQVGSSGSQDLGPL